jgi:hypothetical protein
MGGDRLFGPCDPESGKAFAHVDCAYFNTLSGEFCNCECHDEADVRRRIERQANWGIVVEQG